jgi:hypothetical protein
MLLICRHEDNNLSFIPIILPGRLFTRISLHNTQATRHIVLFGIGNSENLSADLQSTIHNFSGLKAR